MKTIKPATTQLFCKPIDKETKTQSGFFIADKAAEDPKQAEVINVGDKVTQFKSKDTIVYKPYATNDIELNGTSFFLIDEEDVLGVVLDA